MPDTTPTLDFADPRDNVYAFGKMWGTLGDEPVYGTFHGAMYASIGDERLRPLFGYAGTGVTKCRILDNGHLQMRGKETGVFYDLVSGEPIDVWHNPWTDEDVEVYHFFNDRIGGELGLTMPKLHVGDSEENAVEMNEFARAGDDGTTPFILPWHVFGDEVLLEWDYAHNYPNPVTPSRWPRASTGPTINPSEHFTIFTSMSQLADRSLPSANFRAGFSRLSPWWPWMRMGQSGVKGVMFGRLFSRKAIRGLDDIPRPILDRILRDHPDYLEMPTDWTMGPILSTWEGFARDVPAEV